MRVERDVLQKVFSNLEKKYKGQGWIIEYVDLRWGISTFESVNNKTMEICLEELSRCQHLSPRPNFIILLGERRGWIPLPEKIKDSKYQKILNKLSSEDQEILNRWYIVDTNNISEPIYELRPKDWYGDITLFDEDRPLLEKILKKYYDEFGLSATEIEIKNGIIGDESKHAIGYFRNLSQIPKEEESNYASGSFSESLYNKRLHHKLKHSLAATNQIIRNVPFSDLRTEDFKLKLGEEFELKISALIDHEIEKNTYLDINTQEQEAHESLAKEESTKLFERDAELKELCNWVEKPGIQDPLWLTAPSGTGKSALTGGLAAKFLDREEWNVIIIYCGLTPRTSTLTGFLNYLSERTNKIRDKEIRMHESFFYSSGELIDWEIKNWITGAAEEKPLLLIVDGLDRLQYGLVNKQSLLSCFPQGEDQNRSKRLRIVLTSTDESEWTHNAPLIPTPLGGIKNPGKFIDCILRSKDRKITSEQNDLLIEILPSCDHRPVYLSLLASCLAIRRSYAQSIKFPADLFNLVEFLLFSLKHKGFQNRILDLSLALIIQSEGGLRQSDLPYLLGMDDEIWENTRNDSSHILPSEMEKERRIPTMLWSRIFSELRILLRSNQDPSIGEIIDISHPVLAKSLSDQLPFDVQVQSISLLKKYFEKLIQENDLLAFDRIIKIELKYDKIHDRQYAEKSRNALDILLSPSFFIPRKIHFGYRLEDDADLILSQAPDATPALELQKDMNGIYDDNEENIIRRILNFQDNSITKRAIKDHHKKTDLLLNALRNETIANTEMCYLDRMTKVVMTGATSLVGYSLRKSRFVAFDLQNHVRDLGSEVVYRGLKYFIDFADGTYLCCSRVTDSSLVNVLIWNWQECRHMILIEGLSKACEWMSQDKIHGYLYFGNDHDGTYQLNLNDTTLKRCGDIKLPAKTFLHHGNGTISNYGKTLWGIDGSEEDTICFYCWNIKDLFENHRETYKLFRIPSHPAAYITAIYVDDIYEELFIFYADGGCVKYKLSTVKDDGFIIPTDIDYTYAVNAIWFNEGKDRQTHGVYTAYSQDRGVLFNHNEQKYMVGKDADAFNSINSLSCNMEGSLICASYGWRIRSYGMNKAFFTRVSTKNDQSLTTFIADRFNVIIPFNFDLLSYTQVSPDGRFLAFAATGDINSGNDNPRIGILALDDVWGSAKCWEINDSISKIVFGKDSKRAYYIGGHWTAMDEASLYVVTNKGELLRYFPSDMTDTDPDLCISESESHVCVWDKWTSFGTIELRIYDIPNNVEKKMAIDFSHLYEEKSRQNISVLCIPESELFLVSSGRYIYIIDPYTSEITKTIILEREAEAKAFAEDSNKVWMIDKEKRLYSVSLNDGNMINIKNNVAEVYPTPDGKHIFTVSELFQFGYDEFCKDTRVAYSRIDGTECEYAILKAGAGMCKLTSKGLVISDFNNDLLYFTPSHD